MKPGPKKLRRTEYYVAVRANAVRAVRAAFPHLTSTEIADALGFNRHMVKHYLLGDIKSDQNARPSWAEDLFAACRLLGSTQPARAADAFDRLAKKLFNHQSQ